MSAVQKLHELGQSIWYDNIQRRLLENGELAGMIARGEIRGVTSNPAIFHNAIAKSRDYDSSLVPMAWAGWAPEDIFYQLAVEDICAAAGLFTPLYQYSKGGDGYVSLEVSPYLAHDAQGTVKEALRLWNWVARPNLMIKIPATKAGLPAITQAIAAGLNVNVTLIFSIERYAEVMEAYLQGLEQRIAKNLPVDSIASVASFFVSRVDTKIDARLQEIVKVNGSQSESASSLMGKAAIANARLAYELFLKVFGAERFKRLEAHGAHVQRPLWASTSTKNPAMRDVIYIEELIGPHTVNTVPPQTLTAFLEHGEVRKSIDIDLDEARQVFSDLAALQISIDEVTNQLEEEGVKAFADAFTALLKTIEDRRQTAAAGLGSLQTGVVARVKALDAMQYPRRLWSHDPALWTEDPDGQAEVRQRLGWLEAPDRAHSLMLDLSRLVDSVQAAGYTHAVLLGMGGSSLSAEVFVQVFGSRELGGKSGLELLVLDSTDPGQVRAAARWSAMEQTLYIVASKSGKTVEINAFMEYFWARAHRRMGEKAGSHFVAITDPGTPLEKIARERKFRRIILADQNVGGRYSALTAFGLTPAALLGLDLDSLMSRARWMFSQCAVSVPAGRNPGLVLGAVLGEACQQGRDKLTIIADPQVESFGAWLEQLIAESTGKLGKGILPVDIEPSISSKKYGSDRLFIYLRCGGEMEERTRQIQASGHPLMTFTLQEPYEIGAEFFRWEIATAVACSILGVNSFDQPDVQDSKTRTTKKVEAYQNLRSLEETPAIWEGMGGYVSGWDFPGLNGARTLADVVKGFTAQAHTNDFIAINAYLPRNPRNLSKLQSLRAYLLKSTQLATTLGFGPRFLHSTGQLHKGGANNGLFIMITQEPTTDLEIPGMGISFGVLEQAQALGDLEALLARGRRVIHIHLVKADIKDLQG